MKVQNLNVCCLQIKKTFLYATKKIFLDIKSLSKIDFLVLVFSFLFFLINTILEFNNNWMILSFGASIVSVINVLLIAKRKVSNFFWGILSCIFYGIYAWKTGYIGDAVLNFIWFLPWTVIGFFQWRKQLNKKNVVKKRIWKNYYWLITLISTAIIFVAWAYLIPQIAKLNGGYQFEMWSWQHILDSFTNTMGVISTIMLQFRFSQQYICYLISNPMNIIMWIIMYDLNMILVYIIYGIITIIGTYNWFKKEEK